VAAGAPGVVSFHRPARSYPEPVPVEPIEVAEPPSVPPGTQWSWLQLLLPVVGSLGMLGFALVYRNAVFLMVAGGIAGLTLVIWIGIRVQQVREARRNRRKAAARYRAYIARQGERIERVSSLQRSGLERLNPDVDRIWGLVRARRTLWERRRTDDDFLEVRIGLGDVSLAAPLRLELGSNPLTEHEPDLLEQARGLVEEHRVLRMAPVTISAADVGSLAVVGDPSGVQGMVRAMLCQIVAFHAPDDLRIVASLRPEQEEEWGWMKWLPHARGSAVAGPDEAVRHTVELATDPSDLEVVLAQIVRPRLDLLERLKDAGPQTDPVSFQQVVVVIDGYEPAGPLGRLPIVEDLLTRGREIGVTLITLVEEPDAVPSTIGARIDLAEGGWISYTESGADGRRERRVRADAAEIDLCEAIARAMAPLRLRVRQGRTTTVDSEGLLDLLGLPDADALDPAATWEQRDGDLLRTPIGVGEDGSPVSLDLKEAAEEGMGPHGLIVGATGSGKSELLRTLVTGLAVTHAPEDLAFVLVDYKGGATFAEVSGLPHVAGMITNLERDLTLVDRMHEALFGELERRQRLLQEAGYFDRVRDYQAHRRERGGDGLPPLPSLLVVVDEFGELLTTRPDFLDLFVSIGRTGRSLGIHLLLATQRLDEGRIRGLEGHLRYRICLRTFSAEESLVALGTRDAFELPPLPGLGYLKVDTGMQRFKAALATRPYRERRPLVEADPEVVRAFDPTGPGPELAVLRPTEPLATAPSASAGTDRGDGRVRTEMQVVVKGLARATDPDRRARQVWLPPLPAALTLDAVVGGADPAAAAPSSEGWLRIPIGLLDRPRHQAQVPFLLDFTGAGGHLAAVGAPRAGKSMLLQTVVGALTLTHDPADVQVYAADFGGGGLHALSELPHVGAVFGRGDREGIHRLVRELRSIVADRAASFRNQRIEGMAAYHQARSAGRITSPHGEVFLAVDNWSQLVQELPEVEDDLTDLVATGLHYGVHVVLSANRWNDLRLAVRDNVGGRLELRLNDPIESEVDRRAAAALPEASPGRALTRRGEQMQVALPRVDGQADAGGLSPALEGLVSAVARRWEGSASAPPIPQLPAEVRREDLPNAALDPEPGVAIGVDEFGLGPARVDLFTGEPHFVVYGDAECGKSTFLRAWIERLGAKYPPDRVRIAVVDYRRTLIGAVPETHMEGYAVTPQQAAGLAERLAKEASDRLPSPDLSPDELSARRWWSGPELVLFVDDYDLIPTSAGNPLAPLVDLLPQGRDVGLHVVLSRRVGGSARSQFEPFLQRLRELGSQGLIMSGDPQEGPLIGDRKAEPLPPGRGYLVHRRRTSLVQTVHAAPEPRAGEDKARAARATKARTRRH
jgi:S-DNA-T family DNA segregation ATPase FtsK/SpoIIIE